MAMNDMDEWNEIPIGDTGESDGASLPGFDEWDDNPIELHYGNYAGTYAQDYAGLSDEAIDDALEGDPEAYWNID